MAGPDWAGGRGQLRPDVRWVIHVRVKASKSKAGFETEETWVPGAKTWAGRWAISEIIDDSDRKGREGHRDLTSEGWERRVLKKLINNYAVISALSDTYQVLRK